jgi:hypothetical protein
VQFGRHPYYECPGKRLFGIFPALLAEIQIIVDRIFGSGSLFLSLRRDQSGYETAARDGGDLPWPGAPFPTFDYNVGSMPLYRIYRMKDSPRQQFRWAPHVSGCASVKPKDYDPQDQIDAAHEYDAWRHLREAGQALEVGDLLETEDGRLSICKYVGFEPAQWLLPEPKHHPEPETAGQTAST